MSSKTFQRYRTARHRTLARQERSVRIMLRRLHAASNSEGARCALFGCSRLVQREGAKPGFSHTHCRYHVQFKNRHGSYWRKTFSKAELTVYRRAARRTLLDRKSDPATEAAVQSVWMGIHWGGHRAHHIADAPVLSADDKARAVLARLAAKEADPRRLLESHLAIAAAVGDVFIGSSEAADEFRLVQVAKFYVRMAGGQHWRTEGGRTVSRYPRSSGYMLRALGRRVEATCGPFIDGLAEEVRQQAHAIRWASMNLSGPLS